MLRMAGGGGAEADRASDGFPRGLAFGFVTNNKDPENLGRVRVKLDVHTSGQDTFWARIATVMSGPGRGAYFLPDKDDEVLVGFIGDPSHPVVLGSVWNAKQLPPDNNGHESNDRKIIRTRAGHELRFDDSKANEIELKLAKGPRIYLAKNTAIMDDGAGNIVEIKDGNITIKADKKITLKASQVIIDASGKAEVKAGGTCKVQGAMVEIN
ncbi:MAG: phage tail protein [Myxococcales bacterium]|nr:phage tail protein [Myxococcales bacterium]